VRKGQSASPIPLVKNGNSRVTFKPFAPSLQGPSAPARSLRLTLRPFFFSFCFVRRLKCCLTWALLVLMFGVALVPTNGLAKYHTHDEHQSFEHCHGVFAFSDAHHGTGAHHAEGWHAHQIGWQQMQKSSGGREIGAPVLVTQVWVNVLASILPAILSVDVPRASLEAKTAHAPPPLLRSMAFRI
jgi:hypothetical protein